MLGPGIPETADEAREVVAGAAAIKVGDPGPVHWPHSQIIALSQLVVHLAERVEHLEAKRKPGRPAKAAGDVTVEAVRAELAA